MNDPNPNIPPPGQPPGPPPGPPSDPLPAAGGPGQSERQWAMFAHLSALLGCLIPFGNIIAPLVIWQLRKDDMPFAAGQAKEALNFQITVMLAALLCVLLMLVLIGFLLLWALAIAALILVVIAAIKANEGVDYRYPFALRLIS